MSKDKTIITSPRRGGVYYFNKGELVQKAGPAVEREKAQKKAARDDTSQADAGSKTESEKVGKSKAASGTTTTKKEG